MIIELSTEQEALIEKYLATGRFKDQHAVLDEALYLLERKSAITSFRDALEDNHERNKDMTPEEADALAEEAVTWVRRNR